MPARAYTLRMVAVLGVDVGGTFTDFFFLEDGRLSVYKRPSIPDDPAQAVLLGLAEAGALPTEVVHGSTVATNAILERRGSPTALVTTAGFRDAVVIGRQARAQMYALEPTRPEPLVPADYRFEVRERVTVGGIVIEPLSEAETETVADQVKSSGAESVAVCLLFSFLNPGHERRLSDALSARGLFVSASIDVLPEYREYERMSTTLVNAYVSPVMRRYLEKLQRSLNEAGIGTLRVMQSDGGSLPAETAGRLAARTVLSGPAGGVAGAFAAGRGAGFDKLISFDMGGTSTDVSLCPGRILYRTDLNIDGLPVRTPAVDIHTVGAGGGSIAWLDAGGALRVGPQSAGAEPGPACYGKGALPTVTDAQLVLGRLQSSAFLDGRMRIVPEAAHEAIAGLATGTGQGFDAFAASILRVANANMERAIRVISVERGHDPRDFSLLAFGGAGPLHACDLAESLRIPRVVVPPYPGVLSAYGMVLADVTRDYVAPILQMLNPESDTEAAIARSFQRLESAGRREMADDSPVTAELQVERSLDLRYAGQSYEVEVPVDSSDSGRWASDFHEAHRLRYGHGHPSRPVEAVNARVRLRIRGHKLSVKTEPASSFNGPARPVETAGVWFDTLQSTPVYRRSDLNSGMQVQGPAIVVQMDSTTVVNPGWYLRVDRAGNLIMEHR